MVYLGVEVLTAMQHQYIYTQRCWATPSADPLQRAQVYYPIMDSGCPSDQFTQLEPRLDLEDRFETQTLRFPNEDYVYIQCDVIVCDLSIPNDPDCQSTCRPAVGPQQSVVSRVRISTKNESLLTKPSHIRLWKIKHFRDTFYHVSYAKVFSTFSKKKLYNCYTFCTIFFIFPKRGLISRFGFEFAVPLEWKKINGPK